MCALRYSSERRRGIDRSENCRQGGAVLQTDGDLGLIDYLFGEGGSCCLSTLRRRWCTSRSLDSLSLLTLLLVLLRGSRVLLGAGGSAAGAAVGAGAGAAVGAAAFAATLSSRTRGRNVLVRNGSSATSSSTCSAIAESELG